MDLGLGDQEAQFRNLLTQSCAIFTVHVPERPIVLFDPFDDVQHVSHGVDDELYLDAPTFRTEMGEGVSKVRKFLAFLLPGNFRSGRCGPAIASAVTRPVPNQDLPYNANMSWQLADHQQR